MNKWISLASCLAVAGMCSFGGGVAHGQVVFTEAVANGEWSQPSTWSAGVPDSGIFGDPPLPASINGGFEVSLNTFGNSTNLLDVGTVSGETGTLTVTGGDLTITDPDAAEPNIPSIRLGQVAGSTGVFNLSGGDVFIDGAVGSGFANGELIIGDNGTGAMNITGGSVNAADEVFVGLAAGSVGELNVSDGTVNITGRNLLIGFGGANTTAGLPGADGTFNLSGTGTVNVAGFLLSSFDTGATSLMTQTGGTLNLGSAFVHGRRGNATFDHSGGAVNVTGGNGDFVVGDGGTVDTGPSIYNMSGTATVTMTTNYLIGVFNGANGVVNHSGGTVTVGDDGLQPTPGAPQDTLIVARDGVGTYNLSGGSITTLRDVFLGDFDDSLGTFNLSGGALNVMGNLNVGAAIASNANNFSSGTVPVRVEPNGTNGPQGQALDADGVFNVIGTGGTVTVGGALLANPDDKSAARNAAGQENDSTLRFTLGSTGISTIDVAGLADLDGAVIDIDDSAGFFAANPEASLTLIDAAGGFGNFYNLTPAEQVVGPAGAGKNFTLDPSDASAFSLAIVASGPGEALVLTSTGVGGIPGDFDFDGDVDGKDFLAIQRGLGSTTDQSDIEDFRNNFGEGVTPVIPAAGQTAAAVPEPGAMALLLAAALYSPAILAGRRRRKN